MTTFHVSPFARIVFISLFCFSSASIAETKWWQAGEDFVNDLIGSKTVTELSVADISAGLKEALRIGTDTVVNQLSKNNGFNGDPAIHIPLPESLYNVQSALDKIGLASMLNDLELKLNRSAEVATSKAKKIFWNTISQMTIEDIKGIYNGPDDAATRYLQSKMSTPLKDQMRPVINDSLAAAGAVQSYNDVMQKYQALPFVPDVKANLADYALEKALNGIFHYLAIEEGAIRKDPAKRTTELLKRVFSQR